MKKLEFDKTLLEAVDHALLSLGESPRKAIYYHLDKSFKLHKEEIPADTSEFSQALNAIFGPGAEVIKKIILKDLYSKLKLDFEEKTSLEFVDYIGVARELAQREKQRLKVEKRKRRGEKFT
jgi:hypothetical protein